MLEQLVSELGRIAKALEEIASKGLVTEIKPAAEEPKVEEPAQEIEQEQKELGEELSREEIKEQLDAHGIKYNARAATSNLLAKLEKACKPQEEEKVEEPTVLKAADIKPEEIPVKEEPKAEPTVTRDEALEEFKVYINKFGRDKAVALLTKFEVERFGEVKDEDIPTFVYTLRGDVEESVV